MATEQPTSRKWFQFRLPTIILLTALIAMAIAWWRDHNDLRRRLLDAQKEIQFLKTATFFDDPQMAPNTDGRF